MDLDENKVFTALYCVMSAKNLKVKKNCSIFFQLCIVFGEIYLPIYLPTSSIWKSEMSAFKRI